MKVTPIIALFVTLIGAFLLPQSLRAQSVFENPPPDSFQSGVGVISGWACEAEQIDILFLPRTGRTGGIGTVDSFAALTDASDKSQEAQPEGVISYQAAYGTAREDTKEICGDIDNGFGLLFNWNRLGPGTHTVLARADGKFFGHATVTVTTLGQEFLRGASGDFVVEDFPADGNDISLSWQQTLQNFVIQSATIPEGPLLDGTDDSVGFGYSGVPPHVLENPPPGSAQSGVGVISGWVCDAERIEIVFNPGTDSEETFQAGYGTSREDTEGECNDIDNGFGLLLQLEPAGRRPAYGQRPG